MSKLTSAERTFIYVQSLLFFTGGLASLFVQVYLFQIGGFRIVLWYGLVSFAVVILSYGASGYLLQRHTTGALMRWGLCASATLYLLLVIFGATSLSLWPALAIINGIGIGLYWAGANLIQYLITRSGTRNLYFGKLHFGTYMGQAFGPLLGGALIFMFALFGARSVGYAVLFLCVGLLSLGIAMVGRRLPDYTGVRFTARKLLRTKPSQGWRLNMSQHLLFGLWHIFETISSLLIFIIIPSEFILGFITTGSTVIYAISGIVAGIVLTRLPRAYLVGTIFATLGTVLFGLNQNWWGILAYMVLVRAFLQFLIIPVSGGTLDEMDKGKASWRDNYHYLVERELYLGFGRLINYAILILFFLRGTDVVLARYWILFVATVPVLLSIAQYARVRRSIATRI